MTTDFQKDRVRVFVTRDNQVSGVPRISGTRSSGRLRSPRRLPARGCGASCGPGPS